MENFARCAQELGSSLTQHCQRLAKFAQHRNGGSKLFVTLLFTSTNIDMATAVASSSAPFNSIDEALQGWYAAMKQRYDVELRAAVQTEDGAELKSLLSGTFAGRPNNIPFADVSRILSDFAINMSGVPAMAKINWDELLSTMFGGSAGATASKDDVVEVFMRVYGDVSMDQAWFCDKRKPSSIVVHKIFYSSSPFLRLRFRFSHPAVLASEQMSATSGRTVRDVTITFDDDDILPGQSTAPLLRQWKDVVCAFYGIPEAILQKSLLHLQKLVAGETTTTTSNPTTSSSFDANNKASTLLSSAAGAAIAVKGQKANVELLYTDPEAAMRNVDLNGADELTLQEFKDKMTEKFREAVLKPGDPGYEYDKRVEFKATKKSEWDSDDD